MKTKCLYDEAMNLPFAAMDENVYYIIAYMRELCVNES